MDTQTLDWSLIEQNIDKSITLTGWIYATRIHKNIGFIILRQNHVFLQCTVKDDLINTTTKISLESYIKITGKVIKRSERNIKKEDKFGDVELLVSEIKVLSHAKELPIGNKETDKIVDAIAKNKYRFLDIRKTSVYKRIVFRNQIIKKSRKFLEEKQFEEIHTPIITAYTDQGAENFIVCNTIKPGQFYSLAQSPQIYKQALMMGDITRYFQIAPCFRSEDTRVNRLPTDFYQIDLEMYSEDKQEIMKIIDEMLFLIIEEMGYTKKIKKQTITYSEAKEKYGTENVDIRVVEKFKLHKNGKDICIRNVNSIWEQVKHINKIKIKDEIIFISEEIDEAREMLQVLGNSCEDIDFMSYCWIIDFPMFEKNSEGLVVFMHNPFSKPHDDEQGGEVMSHQYDLVINGIEVGGGSIRNNCVDKLIEMMCKTGYTKQDFESCGDMAFIKDLFSYGVPSHGGIAIGLERLCAILENKESIKEYLAFPFMQNATDQMLPSPTKIRKNKLALYGIKTTDTVQKDE